jgi:hypothetical protein
MPHRRARRLAVAALAVFCFLAATAQADAQWNGRVKIVHQATGLALGLQDNRPAAAAAHLVINPYAGLATQKWYLTPKGGGYYWLRNSANTTLCATSWYTPLVLGGCSDGWGSKVAVKPDPAGGYTLRAVYTDIWMWGTWWSNTPIDLESVWPTNGYFRWNITDIPSPTPTPSDDPFPPVCQSKPSLPQCG